MAVSFIGGGNQSTGKKTDLPQVTDKVYYIMYLVHLACTGFKLTTLVVIGTDCKGSCNYHMIMTTMASRERSSYRHFNYIMTTRFIEEECPDRYNDLTRETLCLR